MRYARFVEGRFLQVLASALAVLVALPVGWVFANELAALPGSTGAAIAFCAAALLGVAVLTLVPVIVNLGAFARIFVLASMLLGVFAFAWLGEPENSAGAVTVLYSDGSRQENAAPQPRTAWGKSISGYALHPAFSTQRVADGLDIQFNDPPLGLRLLFSKPKEALLDIHGQATVSDGVAVDVQIFDRDGKQLQSGSYTLSQSQFFQDRWIAKTISSSAGISRLELRLRTGPAGSTPNYDTTLVAVNATNPVANLGKSLLVGLGFLVVSLMVVLGGSLRLRSRGGVSRPRRWLPAGLVAAALLSLTYWSVSRTRFVYFWDYRNHWAKAEAFAQWLAGGEWAHALLELTGSFTADYSYLPSVLPALAGWLMGGLTRVLYASSLAVFYTIPAYLFVAWLGARLLGQQRYPTIGPGPQDSGAGHPRSPAKCDWAYAAFPVLAGLPIYFSTTLFLMPDIGGVVLFVAALLFADALVRELGDVSQNGRSPTRELVRASLGVGLAFGLMFLFRRWYVFAAVGIAAACTVLVVLQGWRERTALGGYLRRLLVSAALVTLAAAPFVCWVLFDWGQQWERHDYSTLYASYKSSPAEEWRKFESVIGRVVLALSVGLLLLARWLRLDRQLLFLLVSSSLVACVLFLKVQSPGLHHFYLLMPLFGAALAVLSIGLYRRFGPAAAIALSAALLAGNLWGAMGTQPPGAIAKWFPSYVGWLPKKQLYEEGLVDAVRWLRLPENRNRNFCLVASGAAINQSLFIELWQIIPEIERNTLRPKFVALAEVDSSHGPPRPSIRMCELALVAVPFQYHLTNQQTTIEIVQQDLLAGTGFGSAFVRDPKTINMDRTVKLLAFKRVRSTTDAEYEDVVRRFLAAKGPAYVAPSP